MKHTNTAKALCALAVGFTLSTSITLANEGKKGAPNILPPGGEFQGKTYTEWATAWWQWVWPIPAAVNPMNDKTGEYAATGQSPCGPVWFLAGIGPQSGMANRHINIPADQAIFFPIVNDLWVNFPELGDNHWSRKQEAYARGLIGAQMDTVYNLTCKIDGQAIKNLEAYRCQTPQDGEFMVDIPEGDVWGVVDMGATPGWHGPCVDDGIYLMVAPLPEGEHTIEFTAGIEATGFQLHVIYHLTVVPAPDGD